MLEIVPASVAAILVAALLCIPACVAPVRDKPVKHDYTSQLAPGEHALELVTEPKELPNFAAGFRDKPSLLEAIDESIAYMNKPSSRQAFPMEGISHSQAHRSLELFREDLIRSLTPGDFADRLLRHFNVYRSVGFDRRGTVLYTGYCEPLINASRVRTERFRFPLYGLPDDLVKNGDGSIQGRRTATGVILPYYSRREIDEGGVLARKGLEIAWLDNPLDAYIVHVQGSASLRLPDGTIMKIGYAGQNGKNYSSLGQALIADGKLRSDEVSLDRIRDYFKANQSELLQYLFKNERYVFFTETDGGPYGSIGAAVTPFRTIATDKTIFPRASVTFLETALPKRSATGLIVQEPYKGFALDQDTGGAIRSAGRVDVFIGTGPDAEQLAGRVKTEGRLYYLFAKASMLD